MNDLILFLNSFLSYLLVFVVFVVCIIGACFAGVSVRKASDRKKAHGAEEEAAN